jgi:hypothetical protein
MKISPGCWVTNISELNMHNKYIPYLSLFHEEKQNSSLH